MSYREFCAQVPAQERLNVALLKLSHERKKLPLTVWNDELKRVKSLPTK